MPYEGTIFIYWLSFPYIYRPTNAMQMEIVAHLNAIICPSKYIELMLMTGMQMYAMDVELSSEPSLLCWFAPSFVALVAPSVLAL